MTTLREIGADLAEDGRRASEQLSSAVLDTDLTPIFSGLGFLLAAAGVIFLWFVFIRLVVTAVRSLKRDPWMFAATAAGILIVPVGIALAVAAASFGGGYIAGGILVATLLAIAMLARRGRKISGRQ